MSTSRNQQRPGIADSSAALANTADFTFACPKAFASRLRVLSLVGQEAISHLFQFDITVVSGASDLELSAFIGQEALLTMRGLHGIRQVHGLILRFEQLTVGRRWHLYRVRLVPGQAMMGLVKRSRVFQGCTTPALFTQLQKEAGFPGERLHAVLRSPYPSHPLRIQLQESDLDFLSRLLEEEGIFYYFEHTAQQHTLVLGDSPEAVEPLPLTPTLRFADEALATSLTEEHLYRFEAGAQLQPGKVTLRERSWLKPGQDLDVQAKKGRFETVEVYEHPGLYEQRSDGERKALTRLQALQQESLWLVGEGTCRSLLPGYTFTLTGHGRADLNTHYLIVSLEHEAHQSGVLEEEEGAEQLEPTRYRCRFRCIPASVPFRPPRITPRPHVSGVHSAMVVGPKNDDIHCNAHGQVRVQFSWERDGQFDNQRSAWLRVAQPWAGAGFGAFFLPRVGQEVLVQFLEGNPDRPVIVGQLHNGTHPPPFVLPEQRMVSGIHTRSSPGGKGYNELRFDDRAGAEQVALHAQADWLETVGRAHRVHISGDETIEVVGQHSLKVGKHATLDARGDFSLVSQKGSISLRAASRITLEVGGSRLELSARGISLQGATITSAAKGPHQLTGKPIMLNCGGGGGGSGGGAGAKAVQKEGHHNPAEAALLPQSPFQYEAYYRCILAFEGKEEVIATVQAVADHPSFVDKVAEFFQTHVPDTLEHVKSVTLDALEKGKLPSKEALRKAAGEGLGADMGRAVSHATGSLLPSTWPEDVRKAITDVVHDGTVGAVSTAIANPKGFSDWAKKYRSSAAATLMKPVATRAGSAMQEGVSVLLDELPLVKLLPSDLKEGLETLAGQAVSQGLVAAVQGADAREKWKKGLGQQAIASLSGPLIDLGARQIRKSLPHEWPDTLKEAILKQVTKLEDGKKELESLTPEQLVEWLKRYGLETAQEVSGPLGDWAENATREALPPEHPSANILEKTVLRELPKAIGKLIHNGVPGALGKFLYPTGLPPAPPDTGGKTPDAPEIPAQNLEPEVTP